MNFLSVVFHKIRGVFFISAFLLAGNFCSAQNTIVDWNFPNNPDNATVDYSIAANSSQTISTQGGTGAISYSLGGATTNAAEATAWNAGSGSKWWEINFSTQFYHHLEVSSKQKGSNTGPKDFKVQYKIGVGGTWTDLTGATAITLANDAFNSGVVTDVSLPVACDDQTSVYLRWIMTSNTAITGGAVAAGGTSYIDDIRITGATLVEWNFPNSPDDATADNAIAVNASRTITAQGATNLAFSNTGANTRAAFCDGWDSGNGAKWWEVNFNTLGYYNMELFSRQASSNTGPRDFKVQYKVGTGGTWTDLSGATVTIAGATVFDAGVVQHIMLPSVCENQYIIYLRWIMTSNTAVTGGAVAAAGTSRIDDIKISGSLNDYHYRSVVNAGTWISLNTWETSLDLVNWKPAPALAPPTYRSLTVTVRNPHTVTYAVADTLDQLTINNGGTLVYTAAPSVNNGTGVDIQIDGTLVDSCNTSINFMTSATWQMSASGFLYKHLGGAFDVWRDNYQGGMSTIAPASNIILWKTGAADPLITTVGGTYFPNLTLKNTHTSAWAISFTGSSDYPRILGDFDIGSDGTQGVNFTNTCAHATPIPVTGNTTIQTGSTLTLASAGTSGTGFDLNGWLVVDGTLGYGTNGGSRVMKFSGTNAQSISGIGTATFYSLEMNKISNDLTLNKAITIDNLLNLSQGCIISTAVNLPRMSAGSFVSGASNTSFVKGPISKTGNTDFTFPVGKISSYRPISTTSITGTETFTAEYFKANPSNVVNPAPCNPCDTSLHDVSLHHISGCEYWTLDRVGSDSAKVTLSWDNYSCGVTNLLTLDVARWDGTSWRNHGNGGVTGSTSPMTGTIITPYRAQSVGPFTLASTTAGDNPLPIGLIDFNARYNGKTVDLHWSTATEQNNAFFTVERTRDAQFFSSIAKVTGAGNSDVRNDYSTTDENPLEGVSYYHLLQTDMDGTTTQTDLVAVNVNREKSFGLTELISDKETQSIRFKVMSESSSTISFRITDITGKILFESSSSVVGNQEFVLNASALSSGMYFLSVTDGEHFLTRKFVY